MAAWLPVRSGATATCSRIQSFSFLLIFLFLRSLSDAERKIKSKREEKEHLPSSFTVIENKSLPRAQLSRPPLERMLKIHDELRRGALVNCTKLMRTLEVSRKTVVRDIAFMRDRLDLPIEFDLQIQAYRYTQPVNAFPTVHMTEGELLALLVAQRALQQYRGTPFHRQLEIAFEKLAGGLRDRISFSPADELRAVSFKNIGLGKTDLAGFNALSAAVLRQEEVSFDYRKPGDAKKSLRRVRPYHLANRENSWYLIGFDLERQGLRTFALPRIAGVVVSKQQFERPADFSPEKFFANALGVLGGVGDYRVVIRFAASVAERVRERDWHESQEMRDLPAGGLELKLRLGALMEVEQWILGWGAAAEVVAPAELRENVRQTVKNLAAIYRE
jgi:predicted DNA-binding transcriptional regulator YafY